MCNVHENGPGWVGGPQLVNAKKKKMTCCAHAQPKIRKKVFMAARQQGEII